MTPQLFLTLSMATFCGTLGAFIATSFEDNLSVKLKTLIIRFNCIENYFLQLHLIAGDRIGKVEDSVAKLQIKKAPLLPKEEIPQYTPDIHKKKAEVETS